MVKLRLQRYGKNKAPFYRVVATDSRNPRDGRFIEIIGTYHPIAAEEAQLKINEELANDPNNTLLIERRDELLDQHRDMIESAKDEQQAMKDLAEEGYNAYLNAMDNLIDKRKEMMENIEDMFDYEKNVKDQVKEISNLQKQLNAYSGDTSEESRASIQKLQVELQNAQENLEKTEREKYLEDSQKMLDSMRDKTEEFINERLTNIDILLKDMISYTNSNAETIKNTLEKETKAVGYTLTEEMSSIWGTNGEFTSVVSEYNNQFDSQLTTTNSTLNKIRGLLAEMLGYSEEQAENELDNIDKNANELDSSAPTAPESSTTNNSNQSQTDGSSQSQTSTEKNITVGGKINAGSARIYADSYGGGGGTQYFKNDPIYTVLGEKNGYLKVRHHKASSGVDGWFKKSDVKAYKTGGLIDYTGFAMVHGGKKPEMVLNAKDTENFIKLKDVLQKIDSYDLITSLKESLDVFKPLTEAFSFGHNLPQMLSRSTTQDVSIQIGDIQMYGVNDPETFASQLKYALQNNKSVKNIIQADTIGVMTGRNGLSKFKY